MSRKSLQTLQPSAENKRILVGSGGIVRTAKIPAVKKESKLTGRRRQNDENVNANNKESEHLLGSKNEKNIDKHGQVVDVEEVVVKSTVDEMIASITSAEESISYWKELAEERRKALVESLQENENLHKLVEELKDENQFLKRQNKALEEIAEEAKQLAEMLQEETAETI